MKTGWKVGGLALVVAVAAVVLLPRLKNVQLDFPDPKPANVPVDAVPILYIAKSRLWAKCSVEGPDTRCRIYDSFGKPVVDDAFITYSRGLPVAAVDLVIVPERSGLDHLWLKNGDVLLPRTNYLEHRRNVTKWVEAFRQ